MMSMVRGALANISVNMKMQMVKKTMTMLAVMVLAMIYR